jgi:hypothetical protein
MDGEPCVIVRLCLVNDILFSNLNGWVWGNNVYGGGHSGCATLGPTKHNFTNRPKECYMNNTIDKIQEDLKELKNDTKNNMTKQKEHPLGGCFGCLFQIVGFIGVCLFFHGACATDPPDTGLRHDAKEGCQAIVEFAKEVWE